MSSNTTRIADLPENVSVQIQENHQYNNNVGSGNGIGFGTAFRCLIIKAGVGGGETNGTETIIGAPTGMGNPIVFAQMSNVTNNSSVYSININVSNTKPYKTH